jgi:hypothetical protein
MNGEMKNVKTFFRKYSSGKNGTHFLLCIALFLCLAASCEGNGSSHLPNTGHIDTLIAPSESTDMPIIPNYGSNVPKDQLHVLTRYIGDLFMTNGVSIKHSGAVVNNGVTKMVINTKDLENRGLYHKIKGGGPQVWISKDFTKTIYPWVDTSNVLTFQMEAAVPVVNLTDPQGKKAHFGFSAKQAPVTQLSFGFYLRDEKSGQTFAYLMAVYESRGPYKETAKANDTVTDFVSSPIEKSSRYLTKDPKSAALQSKPFSKKNFFKVHITAKNLLDAIHHSGNTLPSDIKHFKLMMAGILFELPNYVKHGYNASMVKVSNFSVYINHK